MSSVSFPSVPIYAEQQVYSVEEVYSYLTEDIQQDKRLQNILIEGEISNLYPRSLRSFLDLKGKYLYLDLKGEGKRDRFGRISAALLHCAMWQPGKLETIGYLPKEGDLVLIKGSITVYRDRGQVQLTIADMQPKGKGLLLLKLQALTQKLAQEGLFDPAHKKPIPSYPLRIALLAGENTAAQADVHVSLSKRWPLAVLDDYPVPVQGVGAPQAICAKLKEVDAYGYDAIILARGGGSFEDLFYFNDEELARTIYALQTFIVTGIGHEVDFTLAESVADLRAITPTAAAEKITPSLLEVLAHVISYRSQLLLMFKNTLSSRRKELRVLMSSPFFKQTSQQLLNSKHWALRNAVQKLSLFRGRMRLSDERRRSLTNDLFRFMSGKITFSSNTVRLHRFNLQRMESTLLQNAKYKLLDLNKELRTLVLEKLRSARLEEKRYRTLLQAYAPHEIMKKGYGLILHQGKPVKSSFSLRRMDCLEIHFHDGNAKVIVEEVTHGERQKDEV